MSNATSQLDIIFNLIAKGDGGQVTTDQVDALQKAAQELGPAGQQAFDALEKLGKTTAGNDAANDLRQAAQAARELGEALTNSGKGLATTPGTFGLDEKAIQLTRDQVEAIERLSASLQKQITLRKVLGHAHEEESATLQKLNGALAPARAEAQRHSTVLDELKKNQAEEAKETAKATTAKISYKEALKGLALEIPHVGQALRLLTSPISLIGVAAGVGITEVMKLLSHIDELEIRARAFETRNTRIDPMAVIRENVGRDRDGLTAHGAALDEITRQLAEMNLQLSVQMGLFGKEVEADLANQLEGIQARLTKGEINLAEAVRQRAAAQRAARETTEQATLDAIAKQAANEELASSRAAFRASKSSTAAEAMTPKIEKQIEVTQKAQTDVSDITNFNASKRKNLEDQRRFFMDAVSAPNMAKLDFLRYAQLRLESGNTMAPIQQGATRAGAESELQRVNEELDRLNELEANAKKNAAQEERRLAKLKSEQARLDADAQRNRGNSEASQQRGEDLRFRHEQETAGRDKREPKIRATEDSRMQREIIEAEKIEQQRKEAEARRREKELNIPDGGALLPARGKGTTSLAPEVKLDGRSVGDAANAPFAQVIDITRQTVAAIRELQSNHGQAIAELQAEVVSLRGTNKNGRIG